jgi:hypothetical protein
VLQGSNERQGHPLSLPRGRAKSNSPDAVTAAGPMNYGPQS